MAAALFKVAATTDAGYMRYTVAIDHDDPFGDAAGSAKKPLCAPMHPGPLWRWCARRSGATTASRIADAVLPDPGAHGGRRRCARPRPWTECTDAPHAVMEAALEAAYARSDLFARRRELMDAWAAYIS